MDCAALVTGTALNTLHNKPMGVNADFILEKLFTWRHC